MYWTDGIADKIQRSNLDGSGVEDLVITGLEIPVGIALDVAGGKMYWTDNGTDKLQWSNLDGSGVETLVATGLSNPRGIALDAAGGKMYWTDKGMDKIQRSNLDGSGVEDPRRTHGVGRTQKASRWTWPAARCTGRTGGWSEWNRRYGDKIQRSNLDGSGVEDPRDHRIRGIQWGLALDVAGGKMYWTRLGNGLRSSGPTWTEAASKTSSRDDCSAHAASRWNSRTWRPGLGSVVPTSATITP